MRTPNEFQKMLVRGELKEAAEWIKESAEIAFAKDGDLRPILMMLADAILEDKPRPGKFEGQRMLAYTHEDEETGAVFPIVRMVSLAEWERQIFLAVSANTTPQGRVKHGTYEDVAMRFSDGHDFTKQPGCTAANVKRIYQKHKR